jgi:trimethylamine--corrinoid protein Co-methyltransferase
MGYFYRIPEYRILSAADVSRIHETSLLILERVGVHIPNDRICELAHGLGARVERGEENGGVGERYPGGVVHFPTGFVADALGKAGRRHILYGLDRENQAEFGYNRFNFNGSSGQSLILEPDGKRRRRPTRADLRKAIRLGQAMNNINVVGSLVVPSDVPQEIADVMMFYELLAGTNRPFTAWVFGGESARVVIEMMQVAAGGEEQLRRYPFYEAFVEPVSPLTFRKESLDILLEFVRAGLPVGISPMVMAGATGPCSLAGTIAQENAEVLAGLTVVQLLSPGHPVTYGGIAHIFDMKAGGISFGSPEQALLGAALSQMGRSYGLPVYSNTGLSDSKALDAQYGMESAASLAMGGLARGDIFGHLGICGADSAASLEQLVLDNELAGYFIRLFSGLEVSEESLCLEELERQGIGGSFLASQSTLTRYRREFWFPGLADRSNWDTWVSAGGKGVRERARESVEKILTAAHTTDGPPEAGADLAGELDRVLRDHGIDLEKGETR